MIVLGMMLVMTAFIVFLVGYDAPLGALLYNANPGLLNGLQAGVQRHVAGWLWDVAFLPVLELPLWAVPALIGGGLLLTAAAMRRPG